MNSELLSPRSRRRLLQRIKDSLRAVNNELAMLNLHVGTSVGLKGIELDCLDVLARRGPMTPSTLGRLSGVHPATLTGILDRLEKGGWIERSRDLDASDRRTVLVRVLPDRLADLYAGYRTMNRELDDVCADFSTDQLEAIAEFLNRTAAAGDRATDELRR